jgi:transposase
MPRKSPYKIVLDPATRRTLETRARKYTSAYRDVVRARIVLMAEKGMDNDEIALRLNTTRDVVSMWRKRFFEEGLEGLEERPRRGRPAVFSPPGRG